MENITALGTMELELKRVLRQQSLCLDKYGIRVRSGKMDDYTALVIEARMINEQIKWWKENMCQPA